ncbi:helix-turn-helix transcriptional regulator [Pseudomonas sp. 5P_3.1_Bac2]|uniref:helix-turn-helix transcriptional regulator n=1 Tax=Pseudomonas sp. 5P_3.1_Bac2 TaxID=2971617 RepID=UPI0021C6F1F7|nr:helix-turn-helix transcriptional regulator [Pseudomonas sp. 5P_3.1_Bac2]MCU1717346.1 helix-turn-helix transcriptional regulator [Pseudomonas sp. 5P_3.1_Bac2]
MQYIEHAGFRVQLDGLTAKEGQLIAASAAEQSYKEMARDMKVAPDTIKKRADRVRFKMGMANTMRGVIVEAFKRGIIAPLALALMFGCGYMQQGQPLRRPERPRTQVQFRIVRPRVELTV